MWGNISQSVIYSSIQAVMWNPCASQTNLVLFVCLQLLSFFCYGRATGHSLAPIHGGIISVKNRLLTSIKLCPVSLLHSRLMLMTWNNAMPPTRLARSTFTKAHGVTDVLCHLDLHHREYCAFFKNVFMYVCGCLHVHVSFSGKMSQAQS